MLAQAREIKKFRQGPWHCGAHITHRERSSSALAKCQQVKIGSSVLSCLLAFKRNLDYSSKIFTMLKQWPLIQAVSTYCTGKKVLRPNKQIIRPWATFKPWISSLRLTNWQEIRRQPAWTGHDSTLSGVGGTEILPSAQLSKPVLPGSAGATGRNACCFSFSFFFFFQLTGLS